MSKNYERLRRKQRTLIKPRELGEGCEGCKFWRRFIPSDSCSDLMACHFFLDTGTPRNCDGGYNCHHFTEKEKP